MYYDYLERDRILLRLGFVSYSKYLNSDLWKSIRLRAFAQHGGSCKMCGELTSTLHHTNYGYEVLSGKTLKGLVPLCSVCHYAIEFAGKTKRSLCEANNKLALWISKGTSPVKKGRKKKHNKSIINTVLKDGAKHSLKCFRCGRVFDTVYRKPYAKCKCGGCKSELQLNTDNAPGYGLKGGNSQRVKCNRCGDVFTTKLSLEHTICSCGGNGVCLQNVILVSKKQSKKQISRERTRRLIDSGEKTLVETRRKMCNYECSSAPLSRFLNSQV